MESEPVRDREGAEPVVRVEEESIGLLEEGLELLEEGPVVHKYFLSQKLTWLMKIE